MNALENCIEETKRDVIEQVKLKKNKNGRITKDTWRKEEERMARKSERINRNFEVKRTCFSNLTDQKKKKRRSFYQHFSDDDEFGQKMRINLVRLVDSAGKAVGFTPACWFKKRSAQINRTTAQGRQWPVIVSSVFHFIRTGFQLQKYERHKIHVRTGEMRKGKMKSYRVRGKRR